MSNKQKLKNRLAIRYNSGWFMMQLRNELYSQMVAELTKAIDHEIIESFKNSTF